jgi:DNA invertase Pin-like site-specific DNA recombinase
LFDRVQDIDEDLHRLLDVFVGLKGVVFKILSWFQWRIAGFPAIVHTLATTANRTDETIPRRTKDALAAAKRRGVMLGGYRAGSS